MGERKCPAVVGTQATPDGFVVTPRCRFENSEGVCVKSRLALERAREALKTDPILDSGVARVQAQGAQAGIRVVCENQ